MRKIETFNRTLFLPINGGNSAAAWLIQLAIVTTDSLICLIPLVLPGMWQWGGSARRGLLIKASLITRLVPGLNQVTGLVWRIAGNMFTHLSKRLNRLVLARPIALGWVRRWPGDVTPF